MAVNKPQTAELFVWTDIDEQHEEDFNRWYDREHMEERVALDGFRWARRYRAVSDRERRYLALYRTDNIEVFTSPIYLDSFQNQTEWSVRNFERMGNTRRRVMHVEEQLGFGCGAAAVLLTLPSSDLDQEVLKPVLATLLSLPGVLGLHAMRPDEALSTPLPSEDIESRVLEASVVIEVSDATLAKTVSNTAIDLLDIEPERSALFDLLWELRAEDLVA